MNEQPVTKFEESSAAPTVRTKRTGAIVTFAVILALLGLLAWGQEKFRLVRSLK